MKYNFIYDNVNRKEQRRYLRRNSTKAELLLWSKVRNKQIGYIFKRQYSIGPYIVDFYCPQRRLIVELDGNQHRFSKEYDLYRTNYFNALDINVMRFQNEDIYKNPDEVVKKIRVSLLE